MPTSTPPAARATESPHSDQAARAAVRRVMAAFCGSAPTSGPLVAASCRGRQARGGRRHGVAAQRAGWSARMQPPPSSSPATGAESVRGPPLTLQLDLAPFLRGYRADGHGHPAYHPKTLLGVLLYGYCVGVRSSRQVERRCHDDIAFRVLAGNQAPDHVTIARFRVRHQTALAGFLVESLKLCAAAGMVKVGTVALDGTKLAANAANTASHTL